MTCNPGDPCYSLMGKVIQGRSVPGYDVIQNPQVIGGNPGYSDLMSYNGATYVSMPRMGVPKTDAERMATHMARYGNTNLPPRGTGLSVGHQQLTIDWGQVFGGFIVGIIFGFFVFSGTGRKIGYKAGERITR